MYKNRFNNHTSFVRLIITIFFALFISTSSLAENTQTNSQVKEGSIGSNYGWFIDLPPLITSSFLDPRPGRFHIGIDHATNGTIGYKALAVADGYIYRASASAFGAGKAVFVKFNDGNSAMYCHLSQFTPKVQERIEKEQEKLGRYRVDVFLEESIPVKRGDVVGYTGETGVGVPHLHFQLFNKNFEPINPLDGYITYYDPFPPKFNKLGFIPYTYNSTINNQISPLSISFYFQGQTTYITRAIPLIQGDIAVSCDVIDVIPNQIRYLLPIELQFYFDDSLIFSARYDKCPYSQIYKLPLVIEPYFYEKDNAVYHRLFKDVGNDLSFSKDYDVGAGIISTQNYSPGIHTLRIIAIDSNGNKSNGIAKVEIPSPNLQYTNLHPSPVSRQMSSVLLNCSLSYFQDFIVVNALFEKPINEPILLNVNEETFFYGNKCKKENKIVELKQNQIGNYTGSYYIGEDEYNFEEKKITGLSVIGANSNELYWDAQSKLGIFPLTVITPKDRQMIWSSDSIMCVIFNKDAIYRPTYIGIKSVPKTDPSYVSNMKLSLISDVYEIGPYSPPLNKPISILLKFPKGTTDLSKIAIYWFDDKSKRWSYIGRENQTNKSITTNVRGFGKFALLKDTTPPTVNIVQPLANSIVFSTPLLSATIYDEECGIYEDDAEMFLDGKKVIAEYDYENKSLVYQVRKTPLQAGTHTLTVIVKDRVGNTNKAECIFKSR